jgi:hypothetical protein
MDSEDQGPIWEKLRAVLVKKKIDCRLADGWSCGRSDPVYLEDKKQSS